MPAGQLKRSVKVADQRQIKKPGFFKQPGFTPRLFLAGRCLNRGAARLVAAMIVIAVVWLIVLPWWSRQTAMARRLEWLDEHNIDPSAMFYTELEYMDSILQRRDP